MQTERLFQIGLVEYCQKVGEDRNKQLRSFCDADLGVVRHIIIDDKLVSIQKIENV